jgi:hypothetical protein
VVANIEGATDVLKAALQSMTASERERTWERVGEIISLPARVDPSFLIELPIFVQATIWEGAWRVAPWTTHGAFRRRSFYTSPYLNPEIVNPLLLFADSDRFSEAKAIIQSAVFIEGSPEWLGTTRVIDALRRLDGVAQPSVEGSISPPTTDLEHISRVLLIGNPHLSFKIIEQASRFGGYTSSGSETADSYFDEDLRQLICFALIRIRGTAELHKLVRQIQFLYNRVYRESVSGVEERMPMFSPTFRVAMRLPNWRYRATLIPYLMTKGRLFF